MTAAPGWRITSRCRRRILAFSVWLQVRLDFRRDSPARDSDHRRQPSAERRVGREQRVAGDKAIAGKKIVGKTSCLANEQNAGRAVPRVDVKFAIRFDSARGDVGEA